MPTTRPDDPRDEETRMELSTPFHLLRPQDLPRTAEELGDSSSGPAAPQLAALADALLDGRDDKTQERVREALGILEEAIPHPEPVGADPEESPGNRANDEAFAIVRVQGDALHQLRHSTARAYLTLCEEESSTGTALPAEQLRRLHVAFGALFALYSGPVDHRAMAPQDSPRPHRPLPPHTMGEADALRRWTRGHHVFMALVQGMVVAFSCMGDRLRADEPEQARPFLILAGTLMRGSAAALAFTGDFPYSAYSVRVRPTLIPPNAPPDMTGLRWRDHEYLIRVLTELRPVFGELPPLLEAERGQFAETLEEAYEAHKTVCSHFVGSDQSSVLMADRTNESAVTTLDRFKRSRRQLVSGRRARGGTRREEP
ncbi:hypothetical protein KQH42_27940 [Streptomyces sp. CHA1]|uniref:hypothetical protein n=2 Tax=Streptomyces TaxID=1883 RepID=UPI0020947686|nr:MULTISPECIES: hypothetical protein [unclassified Streptomyces]MCO6704260.1 hypothetical protein [Streptomyces sp. CHB9.2]MCO6710533.1 hypothetical protein [Streptomyces sp. CHA3]MCO6722459.1 hypothetical protein [Streptomyces sp. Vc714c-19]MCO6734257.1 hypothetical protein [Streptomyces sp. EL9]MCO6746066.1 hypothetical protein [Streptomyces sp. CHA1]